MLSDPRDPKRWRRSRTESDETSEAEHRYYLVGIRIAILVLFAILTAQLFRMQIIQGSEYEERARNNRIATEVVHPLRGLIYARDGTPVVENEATFSAIVIPAEIDEDEERQLAEQLERLLNVPAATVRQRIDEGRESIDPYDPVVIQEDIDRDVALTLRQMNSDVPGVDVRVDSKRHYLFGDLLTHVVGYVGPVNEQEYEELQDSGYTMNDILGKDGVEAQYEGLLRGDVGYVQREVDAAGNEVRRLDEEAPEPGKGLVLSIDLELQKRVQELAYQHRGRSKNVVAIVMDVKTGEILAMVSVPTFDANILMDDEAQDEVAALFEDPGEPLLNHAIGGVYPPGSTFKQITGLAALQEGVATPSTTIESKGYLEVLNDQGEFVHYAPDWAPLGVLDFYRGVAMSSDVYFYYLAGGYAPEGFRGLGADRLAQYARAFGIGRPTGIDLPGEAPGIVPDPEWKERTIGEPWVLGDSYNYGIGQGFVTTTPLQMLNATAAIANGGELLRPHVVRQVVDDKGRVVVPSNRQVIGHLPISPENLAVMRQAMVLAVTEGTASPAAVSGVTVAGKTGTAEFGVQLADGSYDTTHGWFTGFAPADDPQIAVVTFVEHGGGNQEAAPLAQEILDFYFHRGTESSDDLSADDAPAADSPAATTDADAAPAGEDVAPVEEPDVPVEEPP
ncbi:MAG TPA: penicillin-binding protein 2, partial [Dehalococcoidia bacterium]|nr:penicillin-binding protein 2 [Dehalococcoidia bacterium]